MIMKTSLSANLNIIIFSKSYMFGLAQKVKHFLTKNFIFKPNCFEELIGQMLQLREL